ncbi:hypothetical protein DM02DRAFT_710414 [Periconia macrospinosa]|uniref:Wax synthase domain-containing protein n=1 Tax=Periconia macrospinosa TaxID=97972 RepID=A0A2V1DNH9_9PLEO|nr:hypothetical protein DM02DRAFT_710414 [Periconia macrospinosa]
MALSHKGKFPCSASVLFGLTLGGFITPTCPLRLTALLPLTLCVTLCIPQCMPYMTRTPWAALVGWYAVTHLYHYLDVALLSRWSFEDGGPVGGILRPMAGGSKDSMRAEKVEGDGSEVWERFKFGVTVTMSFRFVGTRWAVRNTPRARITQRKEFLRCAFLKILVSYCVLDLIGSSNDPKIDSCFLTTAKIPLLTRWNDVTAEELTIRSFTVLAAGVSLNCVQGGIYHICALLAVSTGVSDPGEWPPFYGDVGEAYLVRRFWDNFWHQTKSRKFSSIAHYVTHVVAGLPRGTIIGRYTRILVAFTSSGVMHLIDDLASEVSIHESGAMRFFLVQALGVIVDDCIVRIYNLVVRKRMRISETVAKTVGFVWVAFWLTWSVPAYMYPMLWRANLGLNGSTVSFSFFGGGEERWKAGGCLLMMGVVALMG